MGRETYTLLEDTAHQTSCLLGTVFQGRRSSVAVKTTHRNTEEGTTGEELGVSVAKASTLYTESASEGESRGNVTYQLKHNEQQIIHHKRPLPTIPIRRNTKDSRPHRPKHQHQGNPPGNIRLGLVKRLGQTRDGEGDAEEVKGVPGLRSLAYAR